MNDCIPFGDKELTYPDLLSHLKEQRITYEFKLNESQRRDYQALKRKVNYITDRLSDTYAASEENNNRERRFIALSSRHFKILILFIIFATLTAYLFLSTSIVYVSITSVLILLLSLLISTLIISNDYSMKIYVLTLQRNLLEIDLSSHDSRGYIQFVAQQKSNFYLARAKRRISEKLKHDDLTVDGILEEILSIFILNEILRGSIPLADKCSYTLTHLKAWRTNHI